MDLSIYRSIDLSIYLCGIYQRIHHKGSTQFVSFKFCRIQATARRPFEARNTLLSHFFLSRRLLDILRPRQTSALSVSHWYCTVEILTLASIQTHTVNVYHRELFSSVQTIDKFGNEQTMYSWRLQSSFYRPASNATNCTSGLSLQQHTSPIQMTVPSLMPQTCTKSVQSLVHPDIQIKFLAWLIFKRMESASAECLPLTLKPSQQGWQ